MSNKRPRPNNWITSAASAYNAGIGAYNQYKPQFNSAASVFADFLASQNGKQPGATRPPPVGVTLKNSKLKSYLDRTYAKKCGVEVKRVLITTSTPLPASNAPAAFFQVLPTNGLIPLGASDQNRVGNTIEIKRLQLNSTFSSNVAIPFPNGSTRIRVVAVKCSEGAPGVLPTVANVFTDIGTIRSSLMIKDEIQGTQYTILKQWDFILNPPTSVNSGQRDRHDIKWDYKPKGCHAIRWTDADTLGTTANIYAGAIALYGFVETIQQPPLVGYAPVMTSFLEIDYVDL